MTLQRAVVGGAFFVARDQQAERAKAVRIAFDEVPARVDHGGETAFHVGRAAADELVAATVAANGSTCHCSGGPLGTTSVWPANTSAGAASPRRAQRLSTSPNFRCSVCESRLPRAGPRSAAGSRHRPAIPTGGESTLGRESGCPSSVLHERNPCCSSS